MELQHSWITNRLTVCRSGELLFLFFLSSLPATAQIPGHNGPNEVVTVHAAAAPSSAAAAPISGQHAGHIRILFGGDTDFGESYQEEYASEGRGNILEEKGYDYGLANLSRLLQAVDYRILNLETPLTRHRDTALMNMDKDYIHYSDPVKAPAALGRFGPIAYSLANNHTLDQGAVGLQDTFAALDAAGARCFGAGKDIGEASKPLLQTFQIGATTFTVAVFGGLEYNLDYDAGYHYYAAANRPGVAPIDAPAVESAIRDLRRQAPNIFVIYFMHRLESYEWKTPGEVASVKALKSAGVNLVIGAGAHRMQEVEFDGSQWTVYGIGNFLFNANGRYARAHDHAPAYSLPLVVDFSLMKGRPHATLRIYPILSDNKITNYQPRFLNEEEMSALNALLAEKGHWDAAARSAVKQEKDEIGYSIVLGSGQTGSGH
jgi:poly-gamma-glutamate capsule biosynthesis protein CapA/YwtB (metallophosphatase superfamily)